MIKTWKTMNKLERSIAVRTTEELKDLITPSNGKNIPYYIRKVADELRRRKWRVSLKYGTVVNKMSNKKMRDPKPRELEMPEFEAVWQTIKGWDIEDAPGEGAPCS